MLIRKYELLVGATLALALGLCLPYFISYYVYGDYSGREHESQVVIPVSGGGLNLPAIDVRSPTPGTPFAPQFVLIATDGPLVPGLVLPGLVTSTPTARPTSTLATFTPTSRPSRRATETPPPTAVRPTSTPPPTAIRPTNTLPPPTVTIAPTKTPIPPTATPKPPTKTPAPTRTPTDPPTAVPTDPPTAVPTDPPTAVPTDPPTEVPTDPPTAIPTDPPTAVPTDPPTQEPTPIVFQLLPWELGSAKTAREKPLTFI